MGLSLPLSSAVDGRPPREAAARRVRRPTRISHGSTDAARRLLAEAGLDGSRLPVLVFFDGTVLVDPPFAEIWRILGMGTRLDVDSVDVVVVGGGPAGLAAAVHTEPS